MRRQILLASVGAIAIAGSAYAADIPSRAPPPVYLPPPPIFTWTGIYVGGQVGYAWGNDNVHLAGTIPSADEAEVVPDGDEAVFFASSFGSRPKGVIGGAHLGYNLQIGQWVIGLEGSVDGTSVSTSVIDPVSGILVGTHPDVQGSIRGRLGVAFDRWLIYGTGGAAFAGVKNQYTDTRGIITGVPGILEGITKTRTGWTVGGGIAYAITYNWSIGAEYRYSDFGRYDDFAFGSIVGVPVVPRARHHLTENQVQAEISYRFGLEPAPVVAKY
jgi:outer membrane immunogenic protein